MGKLEKSVAKSTIQITLIMFVIKILGVVKQSVIASVCGATKETDAYFIATSVIIALCSVFFSSISISFLSIYTESLFLKGKSTANNLVNSVLRVFLPISIGIMFLFMIFAPQIANFLAPTYSIKEIQILSEYIRILSIMFVFTSYYLIINVVLETNKQFLPGKGQSLFQNLFVIIAALLFYNKSGIKSLVYAFVIAGVIQCIQITYNARKLFSFKKNVQTDNQTIKKLLQLSIPLILGNAIYEINDIVDKRISSGLGDGRVSTLSFGASINEIVTTLIVASISTVLFSHFSTWIAEGKRDKVEKSLPKSIEALLVLIMPIMIMCFICSDYIVEILFGRGGFGYIEIKKTSAVVIAYAVGFFFQASRAIIVKVYYAFQDTKRPMINGVISVTINICLSIILSKYLGVSGIALATSISMLLVTILLLPSVYKYLPNLSFKTSIKEYAKVIVISIIVFVIAKMLRNIINVGTFLSFIMIGLFVVILYVILLVGFKVDCIKNVKK